MPNPGTNVNILYTKTLQSRQSDHLLPIIRSAKPTQAQIDYSETKGLTVDIFDKRQTL